MWRSAKVWVTPGFWLLWLLALLAGAGPVLPLILLSAFCHEAGHLLALRLCRVEVQSLRLTALGAEITADTRYLPYGREILCTLAGPAVNLLLALLFSRVSGDYLLSGTNLLLGLFNLLPIPSLDGGRALHLLISWVADPLFADRWSRWVGIGCSLLLIALSLVLCLRFRAGLFLPLAALGTLSGQLPLVKRRKSG